MMHSLMEDRRPVNLAHASRFAVLLVAACALCGPAPAQPAGKVQDTSLLNTVDDWGRPWVDCTYSLYKRLAAYRTALADKRELPKQLQFALGTEISLRKVFRNKAWFKGELSTRVSIAAAKGEEEAFQLVVIPLHPDELAAMDVAARPADDGEDLKAWKQQDKLMGMAPLAARTVTVSSVTVSDLKQTGGQAVIPASRVTLRRVGYIKTLPSQYPVMHVGWWPDPLPALEPFSVSNPNVQPIWVEVDVPHDVPAGEYVGRITVQGPHELGIDLAVQVWDFAIPEYPAFPTAGWALAGSIRKQGVEVYRQYAEYVLDHGVSPWDAAQSFLDKKLVDMSVHDENLKRFVAKGLKCFEISRLQGEKLKAYYEHLKSKGWEHLLYVRYHDEPHEREYPSYLKRYREVKAIAPQVRISASEQAHPGMLGAADVWIGDVSTERPDWNQAARKRGDSVWWYYCHLPIHAEYFAPIVHTPGMVVDLQGIDHRIIYWLAWKAKVDGVGYWAIAAWPKGNKTWSEEGWKLRGRNPFPYSGIHNGNGYIVYPGPSGPIGSIRLKTIRDGLEDYDYLLALRRACEQVPAALRSHPTAANARALLDVPAELAVSPHYYNRDPFALLRQRARVANAIVAVKKLAGP